MVDLVGYLRFSHPARSDVRLQKALSADALRATIWDEARLALRFHCFETFVLPSLAAQTDPNFRICILASPSMPEAARGRLTRGTAHIPQIDLVFEDAEPDETAHDLFDAYYARTRRQKPGTTLHFRIDDDDALSRHMIATMRAAARRMADGEAFSMPNGLIAGRLKGAPTLAPMHKPFHSIGLGVLRERAATDISPYRGPSHSRMGLTRAAHLSPLAPAWIYLYHAAADTADQHEKRLEKALATALTVPLKDMLAALEDAFPFLTEDALLAAIP